MGVQSCKFPTSHLEEEAAASNRPQPASRDHPPDDPPLFQGRTRQADVSGTLRAPAAVAAAARAPDVVRAVPASSSAARCVEELPLTKSRYGVAVSWDHLGATVDIDIQCVVVDTKGTIIDAVYYNNLKALKALTHSGDEETGERKGLDEVIWANLTKLPDHVYMLMFVVAAHSGGKLCDAHNGMLHVLEEKKENEVLKYAMSSGNGGVAVAALMVRGSSAWTFCKSDEPAADGRHFIDILEPDLGNIIRSRVPGAPKRQKVAFAMEKGSVFDLPESSSLKCIYAGLGWDISPSAGTDVDLDVSAVFFSKEVKELGAVFFGNTAEFGVIHSGDNLTGEGDGDDEVITVNLEEIPTEVDQIVFCANIYSKGVTFDQVSNAYCRIVDMKAGCELARYVLREGRGERGLLLSRLFREADRRWGFQALGTFSRGQTYKDSIRDMIPIVRTNPRAMQLTHTGSSQTLG